MDFDENAHAETEYTNWRLQLGLKMLVRLEASVLLEGAIIRWKNRFQNKHHVGKLKHLVSTFTLCW